MKKIKISTLSIAFLLMSLYCSSQSLDFYTITTSNSGLAANDVNCVAASSEQLWFGSNGSGISVFDCSLSSWRYFTKVNSPLLYDRVKQIYISESSSFTAYITGDFLFEGASGVSVYNSDYNTWGAGNTSSGLVSNSILCTDGYYYGSYSSGVCKTNGSGAVYNTSNSNLANNRVICLAANITGPHYQGYWFGTIGGLSRLQDGVINNYTTSNSILPDNIIKCIRSDFFNTWVGCNNPSTSGGGLVSFNDTIWTNYTYPNGPINNQINDIAIDKEYNNIWVATYGGLSCLGSNGIWYHYTTSDGMPYNKINSVCIRTDGNAFTLSSFPHEVIVGTDQGACIIKPISATLNINPINFNVSAAGGNISLNITSNTNWKLNPQSGWYSSVLDGWGLGNKSITIAVPSNTSSSGRVQTIKAYAWGCEPQFITITINQAGYGSSVDENDENNFKIYYSGEERKININSKETTNGSFNLYDVTGKLIKKVNPTGNISEVDATALLNGIYFLEVIFENIRFSKKIMIY